MHWIKKLAHFLLFRDGMKLKQISGIIEFLFLLLVFGTGVFYSCARIAAPPGGPKDVDPPVLLKSKPLNFSNHFEGKIIEIEFDEYIQLREINQQLIISPPLQKKPVITVKGKKLVIKLDEDLKANTTYNFNFGNAIVDNNESNPLKNFQFVFSTGDKIDSLSFKGNVLSAFDLSIPENVSILLYEDLSDSAIYKEKPLYVSKVNEEGNFEVSNLKADTFQVFALQDENLDYIYEPPEMVAFSDSFLILTEQNYHEKPALNDSTLSDSLRSVPDTVFLSEIELKLFKEISKEQYLKESARKRKEKLIFVFNSPLKEGPGISLLDFPEKKDWFLKEKYVIGDTFGIWLKDTALVNQEALSIILNYSEADMSGATTLVTDTIKMRFKKPKKTSRRKNLKVQQPVKLKLSLTYSAGKGSLLNLNESFSIIAGTPIETWDTSKISVYFIKDSVEISQDYRIARDTARLNRLLIPEKWKENSIYKIRLLPGAVTDIYGLSNDTSIIDFKTRELEYYGNIIFEVEQVKNNLILQLVEKEDKLVRQTIVSVDTTVRFTLLQPKSYWIKVIKDDNKNGKWDTGNLLEKIQPERVTYYFEEIKLRSNWDYKKNWTVEFKK